ncbi:hypothetical protein CKA32_000704 [Geitlerinema sp. FC II]|nr:hypothetical protein CKA32_000704 [Geitlerinema sp. FC II]
MGFSTLRIRLSTGTSPVSIPRRDFWVFQRSFPIKINIKDTVSIPRRDFWVFQLVLAAV